MVILLQAARLLQKHTIAFRGWDVIVEGEG
jgi:hypothetical protein